MLVKIDDNEANTVLVRGKHVKGDVSLVRLFRGSSPGIRFGLKADELTAMLVLEAPDESLIKAGPVSTGTKLDYRRFNFSRRSSLSESIPQLYKFLLAGNTEMALRMVEADILFSVTQSLREYGSVILTVSKGEVEEMPIAVKLDLMIGETGAVQELHFELSLAEARLLSGETD